MSNASRDGGASMVEFLIVLPLLLFAGLGVMQFGLIYHAKTILNYATFEAARAGAVNNAQIEVMREELGYRLAPVYGGDGEHKKAAMAIARSMVAVNDVSTTKIKILNPTSETFASHGVQKNVVDRKGASHNVLAIPNSHLRYHPKDIKGETSIQDANLLKIEVTYGYQMRLPVLDMELPLVRPTLRTLMASVDPDNMMYYIRGMIPLKSVATVRMQSESWDHQETAIVTRAFDSTKAWVEDYVNDLNDADGSTDGGDNGPVDPIDCTGIDSSSGLDNQTQLIWDNTPEPDGLMCEIVDPEPEACNGQSSTGG